MRALTRDLARDIADTVVPVEIPELDLVAHVRTVRAAHLARWHGMDQARANRELVALAVCDAEGGALFAEADLEETWREVDAWPAALYYPIFLAALDLNGLADSVRADAGN